MQPTVTAYAKVLAWSVLSVNVQLTKVLAWCLICVKREHFGLNKAYANYFSLDSTVTQLTVC